MELSIAIALIESNILNSTRHRDYDRVVELAKKYKALITGEDAAYLLQQFIKREDDEMFKQRVRLTQLITPALCNSVMTAFYKVSRNTKVTKRLEISDETRKAMVEEMIDKFYGNSPDQNGLDYFLQSRYNELTFCDPNTWIVIEFSSFNNITEFPLPRPFEVNAEEAINFEVANEITQWLLARNEHAYSVFKKGNYAANFRSLPLNEQVRLTETKTGYKYTLYTDTIAVVYEQADPEYLKINGVPEGSEEVTLDEKNPQETTFLRRVFDPKIGYVPAYRIGYRRDLYTDGRTYVNPLHPALPFLMKSVKTVSELDLTMTLHAFPQKIQYVQRCKGKKEMPCDAGKCFDGTECTVCKGSGVIIHTSAQDAITLPMPEVQEDMLDLSKIVQYSAPPPDLIKTQIEYVDAFEPKVHKAVFNSDVFIRDTVAKTATEKELDYESVYDTLSPFAKSISLAYKFTVRVCMELADVNEQDAKVTHAFHDLKLKTVATLIMELKDMNDSGAPSFVKDNVSNDLAELIYAEDSIGFLRYKTKQSFFPFPGKSQEEIDLLLSTNYVTQFNKVLYANFENVFAEIEREDKAYWVRSFDEQWKKLGDKVNLIVDELKKAEVDRFNAALDIQNGGTGGSPRFSKRKSPANENTNEPEPVN